MAEILNLAEIPGGVEAARKELDQMDRATLMAQQLCQRGAINAVEFLISRGAGMEVAQQMKESLAAWLMTIHEVANARGIELISYQAPEDQRG